MIKQDMPTYCLVMVTVASEQEGEKIAEALLAETLAACVSITPVNSFYTWQEKINQGAKLLAISFSDKSPNYLLENE